ncbi:COG5511 Bacteriophage capsid protein [uncultured Caudovirales phage]|uniref:COG5511 Bacteriophage capsid protein n=1 Tax=uncultured Caudovirales phage TaxID=2100421 RepID=A0A6J5MJ74_9CAUD|nr:COG5511 Bacteriophage capsid protein [uncultured Caudovirales phage]
MASYLSGLLNLLKGAGSKQMAQSFEAAKPSPNRSNIYTKTPSDFRKEYDSFTRREIMRKSRYLEKNSGILREYIQQMAILSVGASGITPQYRTADRNANALIEQYHEDWANSPEVSGRFNYWEVQQIISRALDRDGEIFILKTRDSLGVAKIQIIEAHRVGNGSIGDDPYLVDGIRFGRFGEVIEYLVMQDDGKAIPIPANAIVHIYDKQQASGARGYPPLQHSICHLIDQMEMLSNEKKATLDQSKISIHLEKNSGQADEDDEEVFGQGNPNPSKPTPAGVTYITEPGEKLNLLESKRPNSNFVPWLDHLSRDSVMGGLPYEFIADSSKVGAAGVKLSLAKATRVVKHRQSVICTGLREISFYIIGDAIEQGLLPAVDGWWQPQWMLPKQIQLDVSREAYQNRLDIEFGLKSRTEDFAERQQDFEEQMNLRADEAVYMIDLAKQRGIPLEFLYKPSFNWLQPGSGGKPGGGDPLTDDQAGQQDSPPPENLP